MLATVQCEFVSADSGEYVRSVKFEFGLAAFTHLGSLTEEVSAVGLKDMPTIRWSSVDDVTVGFCAAVNLGSGIGMPDAGLGDVSLRG